MAENDLQRRISHCLLDIGVGEISKKLMDQLVKGYETEAGEHLKTLQSLFPEPLDQRTIDLYVIKVVFDHLSEDGGGPDYYPQLDLMEEHLKKLWAPERLSPFQRTQLAEIQHVNAILRATPAFPSLQCRNDEDL